MIRFYILSFLIVFSCDNSLRAQQFSADSLMDSGRDLLSNAEYPAAANEFSQAMKLYLQQEDTLNWIEASFEYGSALVEQGLVRKGISVFKATEEKRPQNFSLSLQARKANLLGWAYEKLEMPDSVKYYLTDGLEFAEQIQDSLQIARISNNLSYYFQIRGDYNRALELQKNAIRYFTYLDDRPRLSSVLNRTFLAMMDLGLYQQAEQYIRESLAIREDLGNPNLLDIAYHNLAWNFELQGKTDSAIIYYQKSLELSRMLGNPYEITQTLENIGGLYAQSGDFDNALGYLNEAIAINREIDRPISTAEGLLRVARIAVRNNDLENATAFYNEALEATRKTDDVRLLSSLYLDMANLEFLKGQYDEAKEYIEMADIISSDRGFKTRQIRAHNLLGRLYETEGDLQQSLSEYRKAYHLSSSSSITERINPSKRLARAYNKVSSDSAFLYADRAFSLIDSVRTNVAGLAFRSGFFSQHAGFYNEVASWYISRDNNSQKAFDLIEAAKARVLMDELAEAQEKIYETLDESTLIKKQQKSKQIDRLYSQLADASANEKEAIQDQLKDLEFEYQSFLNQIQVSNVSLKDFKYPKPVSLKEAQEMLDTESAILEFAFSDERLIRLFITENSISGSVLNPENTLIAREYLTEYVRSYRNAITNEHSIDTIQELGSVLNTHLIPAEVFETENKITNLVIVPDGPLTFLPFETLRNNNRYLIEDFSIKYLPSASIYSFISEPHRATSFDLLALAGSGFEDSDEPARRTSSQASFASLPSTLLEVDSISVNFINSKVLKNDDVTEANLKSHDLSNFRFIHFATHAEVNESTPSQSGLLLSKKADVESLFGEDGYLNSREISGLRLNADLVTLSACNTGMGRVVTGEGLLGLQRSFLSAGASSVMVSLWSVFDRSTSVFMSNFYKQMLAYEQEDYSLWSQTLDWFGMYEHPLFDYKTKALRDAKLSMIDHPYYSHPIYWAPFILVGK